MSRRLLVFLAVSTVPTACDIGLLLALRVQVGLPLAVADLGAIAVASVVSYSLHRVATYGSNPYVRWVRFPGVFALLALAAGVVDAVVLQLVDTLTGFDSARGLLAAKLCSLTVAVLVRAIGYRFVLADLVHASRARDGQPLSDGSLRFSVVIPAYEEGDRIAATVGAIRDHLADIDADGGVEIVVVDDGSSDGTAAEALGAGATQVVQLPENRGKGAAVRAGMLATRGRAVAFTDADLAYDPPHLRRILLEVEDGWDVVIGNRQHPDSIVARHSAVRAVGSRLVNRLSAAVLLAAPHDTQCGCKGFRGDVARRLFAHTRLDGFGFDIEVLHLVERGELSLTDIPVVLDEADARSTVHVVRDVVRLVVDLVRVRRWATLGSYDAVTVGQDAAHGVSSRNALGGSGRRDR